MDEERERERHRERELSSAHDRELGKGGQTITSLSTDKNMK